jgi:amidase
MRLSCESSKKRVRFLLLRRECLCLERVLNRSISFGMVRNPYNFERTAGGSSGGAAALSAAGGTPFDIGADGGGSIRVASHCCGVAGLVPALGRVSLKGTFPPLENSFKTDYLSIGPIARRVEDLALVYDIINGVDPHDPFTWPLPKQDYAKVDLKGLRVGVLDTTEFHDTYG